MKDKIKELQANKKAAEEGEQDGMEESSSKRNTANKLPDEGDIKHTGNMIKSVARTSIKFGAKRDF